MIQADHMKNVDWMDLFNPSWNITEDSEYWMLKLYKIKLCILGYAALDMDSAKPVQ